MKFDRKIFINLLLFTAIIVVIACATMCQSSTAIQIAFSDELVAVSSMDYGMNIEYTYVDSLALVNDPVLGSADGGKNKPELKSGLWQNDTWGQYHLCFNPNATNCIVVQTIDGQTFVFNYNTNEKTEEAYRTFMSRIS